MPRIGLFHPGPLVNTASLPIHHAVLVGAHLRAPHPPGRRSPPVGLAWLGMSIHCTRPRSPAGWSPAGTHYERLVLNSGPVLFLGEQHPVIGDGHQQHNRGLPCAAHHPGTAPWARPAAPGPGSPALPLIAAILSPRRGGLTPSRHQPERQHFIEGSSIVLRVLGPQEAIRSRLAPRSRGGHDQRRPDPTTA